MVAHVPRASAPSTPDAEWNKPFWAAVEALELKNFMGERPAHFPRVQARLAYDDEGIQGIFQVEDRWVRAVAAKNQDSVCRDSCVEFFFVTGEDLGRGYFNLEMNCGGVFLFHWQRERGRELRILTEEECARLVVVSTLPRRVTPEIAEPTTWRVEFRIPYPVLENHAEVTRPAPGVVWRANLYKCGNDTSHPHWLTWAPVDFPKPQFHLPEFFGALEFVGDSRAEKRGASRASS
ncbi:MAG: carbohydrate-binding family 9-like protein [Verrucomicrobiae bacterium]|nr:carbohydrate-binding family 9-like protein [Verrucomicrobiae bacterium]